MCGTVPVFIVDDHDSFRAVARAVVDAAPGFDVLGEASDAETALRLLAQWPESSALVLVDVNLGPSSGIELARDLSGLNPNLTIALISSMDADELPPEASSCGAAAFVPKREFEPRTLEKLAAGCYPWPR